ncbi:lysyl-tRNA synthetase class II [Halanaerobium saccharolyticum]|uniref:Lysine--tRNA ligase n=1 Tax=Halanaerobium saccharolyticum TaxID=43595 RepID=A0A4R7YV76_9FIRM|nr:lysine--tRNA ligase [Halanaerobium saccharolyticum]RAK05106.1 lysyl-tRNA synthetase class II [Halanaerobium saccharolyticum]TDV98873.1 lysyl-tRNA synthetase class II [Halanaerobium saccharolyticum]TDX51575.1 lysyl-tRNA synthetase class II [Halanaerobium saccharolyticum]
MSENMLEDMNELMLQRREKLSQLKEEKEKAFAEKYEVTHHAAEVEDNFEELEEKEVKLAGRLMAIRTHGKASFADLMDMSGKVQLYIKQNNIGEDRYEFFQDLDLGDLVGITGTVFKTNRGQISIRVSSFELLTKSLRPLPEKFHGLKDKDIRYRQRYLDLIVNPDVKETFVVRSKIIKEMRRYLEDRGFLEVETPMMHPIAGGATARPFVTHHNTLDMDLYLRIAPELYLKKLIVGGFEKVFEINRNFRNEGMSYKHNPEFTTLELYQAQADYHDMMELTEKMVSHLAEEVLGTKSLEYEETELDFATPWERITMVEAVKKYADVDFTEFETAEEAYEAAASVGVKPETGLSYGEVLNEVFEERVEDKLIQPTFIMDYPIEVSPLAQKIEDDPRFTYRFEAFVYGREIANAFSELNDPEEQKRRFEKQVEMREAGDEEAQMMDYDFIRALEYGMPPTGGLGIGIDRLIMLLTNSSSIRDVILFPTMRPESNE